MNRKQKKRNNHGFTLIEVVVSFAILSFALLMLATMFGTATRIMGESLFVKEAGNKTSGSAQLLWAGDEVIETSRNLNIYLTIGGKKHTIYGTYKTYESSEKNSIKSVVYVPSDIELEEDLDPPTILPPNVGDQKPNFEPPEFVLGTAYQAGTYVKYNGFYYRVMYDTQGSPDGTGAYDYKKLEIDYDKWSSYEKSDVVRFGTLFYRSRIGNNVWAIEKLEYWERVKPSADGLTWVLV